MEHVPVGRLSEKAMWQLAHSWAKDTERAALIESIEASAGRPGELRRILNEGRFGRLFDGLEDQQARLLDVLAVCHQPIPQSALDRSERFAGSPLDELRTVGLVNRSELGWTMLSQAQVRWLTLRPREALTEARHNALRCLEGLDDPGILTDRLRLLLASGEADAAIELLKERAETLWLRGWAPELWRALRTSELTGLWPWRLSAATHLGKVEEVAALIKQGPPEELANDTLTLAR